MAQMRPGEDVQGGDDSDQLEGEEGMTMPEGRGGDGQLEERLRGGDGQLEERLLNPG